MQHPGTGKRAPLSSDTGLDDERLHFAERAFGNAQELNRLIDSKANFLLASVGLLTGALGLLSSSAINGEISTSWPGVVRVAALMLILVYLLVAFATTYQATLVYRPSANTLRPGTQAPGMLFPLMLINRYTSNSRPDEDVYMAALMRATVEDLIYDYVNQIMENANIYAAKQRQMNKCIRLFQWLSILWVTAMVSLVGVAVLVP